MCILILTAFTVDSGFPVVALVGCNCRAQHCSLARLVFVRRQVPEIAGRCCTLISRFNSRLVLMKVAIGVCDAFVYEWTHPFCRMPAFKSSNVRLRLISGYGKIDLRNLVTHDFCSTIKLEVNTAAQECSLPSSLSGFLATGMFFFTSYRWKTLLTGQCSIARE